MKETTVRRTRVRRRLESAVVAVVAFAAAAGVIARGPLLESPAARPAGAVLAREVPRTAAGRVVASVSRATWDLPNLDHTSVDKWIVRLTGDLKNSFESDLKRIGKYDDMIVAKAEAKGMPTDLVYLALIESGGNATAKSRVGARGLWQFMTPTAKDYGLTSRERLDPVKSTEAALDYLSDLHERFGSWYLAAAAYNTGQGRVERVLKQVTGRTTGTDADFYRIASRLPRETREYVPKLIAAARIAKEPERYGIANGE